MTDKVLSRGFDLAKKAIQCQEEGKVDQAKDMYTASIDCFLAVLATPGFIKDENARKLISSEIDSLKERRTALKTIAKVDEELGTRLEKLTQPGHADNIRERLDKMKGLDGRAMSVEELSERLQKLKGEEGAAATVAKKSNNVFFGEEWKKGLDAETIQLIEQSRDEVFL